MTPQPLTIQSRDRVLNKLPAGVVPEATRVWSLALAELSHQPSQEVTMTVNDELFAPIELDPDWPEPSRPHPAGSGWVHWDTLDEDIPLLDAMAQRWAGLTAHEVATEAQSLRLPVVDYRELPPSTVETSQLDLDGRASPSESTLIGSMSKGSVPAEPQSSPHRRAKPLIVDLSTHWAGPLATKLTADSGMDVVKVDPDCRPDGFRCRPGLYQHLNGSKEIVNLDLRNSGDRTTFEALLATAGVLVESFSRRVLPNFGYSNNDLARLFPDLSIVSMKAFPQSDPRANWLAYGGGVHAASGLGMVKGKPQPTPLPYPDFLAGIQGFRAIAEASTSPGSRAEVSLASSIVPLIPHQAQLESQANRHE